MNKWTTLCLVLGALHSICGTQDERCKSTCPATMLVRLRRKFTETSAVAKSRTPGCGEQVDATLASGEVINLSSTHLLNKNGNLPTNCSIEWRIKLKDKDYRITTDWLRITGALELEDSANDASCTNSHLKVTDEQKEGKNSAITTVECGSKYFKYETTQDMVIVRLEVSAEGAKGKGISLWAQAVYMCGGELIGPAPGSLRTPEYPLAYPPNLTCVWPVKWPATHTAILMCPEFDLPRKGRAHKCTDHFRVNGGGPTRNYCGGQLKGQKKAVRLPGTWAMLDFRSSSNQTENPGFMCDVTFEKKVQ